MKTVRMLYALLTPSERRGAVVLLALTVIGVVVETFSLALVIPAVALLMQNDLAATYPQLRPVLAMLGNPDRVHLVTGGMLVVLATYALRTAFLGFLAWRQTQFAFRMQARLSEQLFATYLHQPYTFHLNRNSGELLQIAINEVGLFTVYCMLPGLLVLTEGLVLLGSAALLLLVEPVGSLIVMFALGVIGLTYQRFNRVSVQRLGAARQRHDTLRTQYLQEGLAGAKEVKLLGREEHFLARFNVHNTASARTWTQQQIQHHFARLGLELLAIVGLTTLVLTMLAQGREMPAIVSMLGLFAAASFRLMPSINRTLVAVQSFHYGLPAITTLHRELHSGALVAASSEPLAPLSASIEAVNLTYTYPGAASPALTGVSLVVRKGEAVGLIGPSGCGKSTLVDVILGLLTPDAGAVLVDGVDIQQHLRGWQNQIGYVPQSVYLTDDTFTRNIAFGLPDDRIDPGAVRRAVEAAQLQDLVDSLPDGLDTLVGERGVRLSGGQRQRIGIARALYHDPAVIVLDEATSALDTVTEHGVMQAVQALQGRKTVLIVAHRLSTVEYCDRVHRLTHGRVVDGTDLKTIEARSGG